MSGSYPGRQNDLTSEVGVLSLGIASHFCMRADSTGFDPHVDGIPRQNTSCTVGWSAIPRRSGLGVAASFTGVGNADLDRSRGSIAASARPRCSSLAQRSGVAPTGYR